ncbi:hypothetical protein ACFQ1M_09740 [Sungkyunkwania multivorans]|uniref:Uncharacterized protein n=1 Tax=Sungkyunkwania multivorans TaxID=1173618 RepID=A0ABW3D0W6_9FLAO
MNEIITILIPYVFGGVSILGYLFERRKRLAEVKSTETDVMSKIQKVYAEYVEEDKRRYDELANEHKKVLTKLAELEKQINQFKKKCTNNCAA